MRIAFLNLKRNYILMAAGIVVLAILPHFLEIYYQHMIVYTLWWVYMCAAWNISAMTKMYSVAHTVFVAACGYTSTLLFLNLNVTPWLGIFAGIGVAFLFALAIGWIGFRFNLPPLSFVILTMVICFIGTSVAVASRPLGSTEGLGLYLVADDPRNWQWVSKLPYHYIILAWTIFIIAINWLIFRSKLGYYFRAIADNERAAAAAGVDIFSYKLAAFVISAVLIAPAGTFWAQYTGNINPGSVVEIRLAILMILFTILGGVGTVWGPVLGALILVPIGEILRGELGSRVAGVNLILYGILIILVVMYMPKGLLGWINSWQERRRRVRAPG